MNWYDKLILYSALFGFGLALGAILPTHHLQEVVGGLKQERRQFVQEITDLRVRVRAGKPIPPVLHLPLYPPKEKGMILDWDKKGQLFWVKP